MRVTLWGSLTIAALASCRRAPSTSTRGPAVGPSTDAALATAMPPPQEGGPPSLPSAAPPVALVPPDRSWLGQLKGVRPFSEQHPLGVLAFAFLPDGVHAMSSGVDQVARLWDLRTGEVLSRLTGPRFKFVQVVFTHDGQ